LQLDVSVLTINRLSANHAKSVTLSAVYVYIVCLDDEGIFVSSFCFFGKKGFLFFCFSSFIALLITVPALFAPTHPLLQVCNFQERNTYFILSKIVVKFTLVKIRHSMPAVLVIHRSFGIPLRYA
jgi:hypothetical protein